MTFEEGVSLEAIRTALVESRSKLIRGPDEQGAWVVEISIPEGMSDADIIDSVRTIQGVEHVAIQDPNPGHHR
ncbi:MAG: hypothetical protein HUJ31_15660 [Pseudomonadales bacterium]|nr:hypothetical protein [Pseudomonadales bacterium]